MRLPLVCLASFSFAVTASAAPHLETLLGAPFPSELTAAPTGGTVAWVENDRGVRNIWTASPPAYDPVQRTAFDADDGQALSELVFTPDGDRLLFVRGGSPNRSGDIPNPTSDPDGAERAIWMVDVAAGGAPRRLQSGSSPLPLSNDAMLLLRGGAVHRANLESEAASSPLFRMRGSASGLALSPDGRRLAFVSARGSHSFIGVFAFEDRRITWLSPGVDCDMFPAWSPDSRRVAFARLPSDPALSRYEAHRDGPAWSIHVADAETGDGVAVWSAEPGPGSVFRGVDQGAQLWWSGDRLVFPWERGGWLRLWALPTDGGEAVLLTPGEHEVEHVTVAQAARTAIYSSNLGDPERRHLWQVATTGGEPRRLTQSEGVGWAPTLTSDGEALAYLRSSAQTPAHPAMLALDGGAARPLRATDSFSEIARPQPITFSAADGMEIRGQLFLPPDTKADGSHPALIFFHGGSRRQMLLAWHNRDYYHHAYAFNQYMASQGYVVLSVNYRSGTGYGLEFRESPGFGAAGGSDFQDVIGAGLFLRSRPEVDGDRIALWGGSYGGYLTALGLARASDLFAAGVDLHGVHDWSTELEPYRIALDGDPDHDERFRVAFQSSPLAYVDQWRSPVLLIHGDDDRNVQFTQTSVLLQALRRRDVDVELLVFPDEVHGFLTHRRWLEAFRAAAEFLDRKLR